MKRGANNICIWEESEIEYILDDYKKGNPMSKTAKEFGVTIKVIRRILKNNDLSIRGNDYYAKLYRCDSNYFKTINTEEKAYWLGFIYADGYITKRGYVGITLANKDKVHLYKFQKALKSDYPVNEYVSKSGFSVGNKYSRILIRDEALWSDLKDKGVLLNKTEKIRFPTESQVPQRLLAHFVRGYFDGDGSIWKSDSKYGLDMCISFCGTKAFLEEIKVFIGKEDLKMNQRNRNRDVDNWTLPIGGNLQVPKILSKMYENATIYLDRKYELYKEFTKRSSDIAI